MCMHCAIYINDDAKLDQFSWNTHGWPDPGFKGSVKTIYNQLREKGMLTTPLYEMNANKQFAVRIITYYYVLSTINFGNKCTRCSN